MNVPYFNQCLQKNQKDFYPNNPRPDGQEVCRNMCTAATMVMIAGFFDKLDYYKKDPDSLKKYMYSNNGQGIVESCGVNQGGAFGVIAEETDRILGVSSCNQGSAEGMRKYGDLLGLHTQNIEVDLKSIKDALDRGNPVILSDGPHVWPVKGYVGDKLVVNDPYRNNEINQVEYNYNGKNALYELPQVYYKDQLLNINYAIEVSDKVLTKAQFKKGQTIHSSADGDGISTGTSVRTNACSSVRIGRVGTDAQGVILDEPVVVEACSLGYEYKVWYKIKWSNGLTGWSVENFLRS